MRLLVIAAAAALATVPGTWSQAADLRLVLEDDAFISNDDDLYSFALAFDVKRDPYRFSFRENTFTDREAGLRFDETYLSVARAVAHPAPWILRPEAGIVHVGRGLFGEDAQNAVHRLINEPEVDLRYRDASVHALLGFEAERFFEPGRRISVGPRFEARIVPALRSDALLGAQAFWQAAPTVSVHIVGGLRAAHASLAPLEPHLEELAPLARVSLVLYDRLLLSWTYNDYGDERQHVSLGYRIAIGRHGHDANGAEAGTSSRIRESPF